MSVEKLGNLGLERPAEHAELVRQELARILASPGFVHSERMCLFLRFVVEASLAGDSGRLKESVIGVEVFHRAPTYDPKLEPIVRVEARRLRDKIQAYYEREGANDPVIISLPKGGYAPTFEIRPEAPLASPAAKPPPTSARPSRRAIWVIPGVALALGATAAGLVWFGHGSTSPPALVPLTSFPGNAFRPAFSPDGKRVAFVWDGGAGNFDIYVRSVNTGDPLRLTTNAEQDLDPAWSPDGEQIAFVRRSPGGQELFIVPSLGGSERKIADFSAKQGRSGVANLSLRTLGPSWSPSGKEIAVAESLSADEGDSIYAIAVDGGEKRRLTKPDRRDESDSDPAFSPNGDMLAFVRTRAGAMGASDLYLASLKGGGVKRLTFDHRQIVGLTWTPDSRRILFASTRDGESRLWEIKSSGGAPALVPGADRRALHPSFSPAGRRVAFTEQYYSTRLWRISLNGASAGTPQPFLSSSRKDDSPQYSPDGRRLVFISDRAGPQEIWTCDSSGGNAAPIAAAGILPGTPRWSPDGSWIVFDSRHEGFGAVYVIGANGGRPRRLSPDSSNAMMPSWSRDGRSIYYASDRTGAWQIWKQPEAGGPDTQITKNGGREGKESLDGRFLYYADAGTGLWRVPTEGGEAAPVAELAQVPHRRHWTLTERGIYYLAREQAPRTIYFFDFTTRRSTEVFTIPGKPVLGTPGLAVSPDGLSMVYSQVDREGSDVMLLDNFE